VIAKLDRLARNVHFISGLMDAGVEFVACDMPHANKLTIHILAAVAEHEREMISTRTKVALAAAKARGQKLGGPKLDEARILGRAALRENADRFAANTLPIVKQPRAPQAGPQEDDGKCAPYPSCPQLTRCFPREVDGRRHRSSQIQLARLARVQANAEADCANPPHAYLRVRSRCCTKKPRSYP
jgi:hypothetical protein